MKTINLLASDDREIARLRSTGSVLRFWSLWSIVLALIAVAMIFVASIVVQFQEQTFSQQVESLFSQRLLQDIVQSEEMVANANDRLLKAQSILNGRYLLHPLLIEIAELMPQNMTLQTFVYDRDKKLLRLGGTAALRADVLALEEALRSSERVSAVDAPVSNILEPTDVDFSFSVTLK